MAPFTSETAAAANAAVLERRRRWAQIKRQLKDGEIALGQALLDPEGQRRPIGELVGYALIQKPYAATRTQGRKNPPRCSIGPAKALLRQLAISPTAPAGSLSPRRRFDLCAAVAASPYCAHRRPHAQQVVNAGLEVLAA